MKSLHLIYHELRPTQSRYSYVVSCSDFEQQCELFSRLQSAAAASPDLTRPKLTFDDGHRSALEHALPVLKRTGLAAQFFITAGWIGERAGYMDTADLRSLHAAGMTIGAHGWSHKLLTHCNATELDHELRDPKAKLEDVLGTALTSMSLPGGRCNARVLGACQEAGYSQVFTSSPTLQNDDQPSIVIGRLNIRGDASLAWLEELLDRKSGTLKSLQRTDRVKSAAKSLLGDHLYATFWGIVNRQEAEPGDTGVHAS